MAEANRISAMLRQVLGGDRFPVDVQSLALEYSAQCFPNEPIKHIKPLALEGFEGMLASHKSKSKWMIAYNDKIRSPGRIRFTLAHEFGHYILHRSTRDEFQCSQQDIYDWDADEKIIEAEADTFASFLLMPLDDYRQQVQGHQISIDLLSHCADRYGVSLMAAALKWLEIAERRAVVVAVRDGHVLWARSNKAAFRSGVCLATRKYTIEVPSSSLLASSVHIEGGKVATQKAKLWFPKEPDDMPLTEMTYVLEGYYPYTLGLLLMPDAEWRRPEDEDILLTPVDAVMKRHQR